MANKKLIIVTGNIQTGKTTTLFKWATGRSDVAGVLTPVKEGRRFFYSIPEKEWYNMEAGENDKDCLKVGRFSFSQEQFEKTNNKMINWIKEGGWKYLIIDEVGPLELTQKKGMWPAVCQLLEQESNSTIILAVRASLSKEVQLLFEAEKYSVNRVSPGEFTRFMDEHSLHPDRN